MKRLLFILTASISFIACRETPKNFNSISIGMTKDEVTAAVGEPAKKNELAIVDIWVYPEANRSVVFKKDTVYNIITSAGARIDSIENSLKNTGDKIKSGLNRIGDSIERTGDQIEDKFRKDTTKN